MKARLHKVLRGSITVIDTLYPGTSIDIGSVGETVREGVRRVVYYVEEGRLTNKPFKPK